MSKMALEPTDEDILKEIVCIIIKLLNFVIQFIYEKAIASVYP